MKTPSKKIMFSLPDSLLEQIDTVAAEENRSRSELIREATRRYIAGRPCGRRPIDDPEIRAAVESMDRVAKKFSEGFDSTGMIREMRDKRYGPSENTKITKK
jgi:Arc/MetJ-type ribon-helix-helix transcriptional regulator